MNEQEPISMPRKVLEELESVRRYARAEVFVIPPTRHVAMETEKPALVVWIDEHEQEYGRGLLNGFPAEDQAFVDGTARPLGRNQGCGQRPLRLGWGTCVTGGGESVGVTASVR